MPIGIKELTFASGPDGKTPLSVTPASVVILVGPNNSGKSLALREVEAFCSVPDPKALVISDVTLVYPKNFNEALELINKFKTKPPEGTILQNDQIYANYYTPGVSEPQQSLLHITSIKNGIKHNDKSYLIPNIVRHYTIRLDGKTRLALASNQPTGDLQVAPTNHLMSLFQNESERERVRSLTKEAFDLYFTIDPTNMREFVIRLSERPPSDSREEQSLDTTSRRFHSNARPISDFSDGVNAFVGLLASVMSLDHRIMLIDEPEAFLHPGLARLLARNLTRIAKDRGATLLVSTHSSSFLLGAIDSSTDVTIIRLTYDGKNATTKVLEPNQLSQVTKSPLLMATRVLDALFFSAAVVVEGDTDRMFYETVNAQLNDNDRGIDQCLFINAQNKQSLYKIAEPLRKIGMPTAVVADFDIVNLRENEWNLLLSAVGAPLDPPLHSNCPAITSELGDRKDANGKKLIHTKGLHALVENKDQALDLIEKLKMHGLFMVKGGTLETWLPDIPSNDWFERSLEFLAENPQGEKSDGVKEFLDDVGKWIAGARTRGSQN